MDYNALREQVLNAAYEGRATYLPAGARNNPTAEVFIDGNRIGQASTLCHYVRPEEGRTFQEVKLLPGHDHQIPQRLRR